MGEGLHALLALRLGQLGEAGEGLLHLLPFGVGEAVQRLRFFGGGEVEELAEAGEHLLALRCGQRLPAGDAGLELFATGGAEVLARGLFLFLRASVELREVIERRLVLEQLALCGGGQLVPLAQAVIHGLADSIGNERELGGAVGGGRIQERQQKPAQLGGAQAEFALVGLERFIFAQLGEDAVLGFWCARGEILFLFGGRQREQGAENIHGRLRCREGRERGREIRRGLCEERAGDQRGREPQAASTRKLHWSRASSSRSAGGVWLRRRMASKSFKASALGREATCVTAAMLRANCVRVAWVRT